MEPESLKQQSPNSLDPVTPYHMITVGQQAEEDLVVPTISEVKPTSRADDQRRILNSQTDRIFNTLGAHDQH